MKLIRVKTKDAKKCDLKPSQRIKVSGNVFVEVYKDNKGYFYRIDIPGATDFVSKERYPSPDKASLTGRTHTQKFMKKIRGDEKKGDGGAEEIDKVLHNMKPFMDQLSKAINAYMKEDKEEAQKKLALFNKMTNCYFELSSK